TPGSTGFCRPRRGAQTKGRQPSDLVPGRELLIVGRLAHRRSPVRLARFVMPALVLIRVPALRQADQPDDDPPSRVGRLSFLSGGVSFRPASVDDWTDATINYPLHGGDHLWTDADARAELTVGSNAIRLAPQSAFGFLALDDRTTQIRLSQGSLEARVRDLGDDESFEIDTPTGAVSLLRPGTYRVDVDATGDTTTVTVRHGQADVTAAGSAFPVHSGDAAVVAGGDAPSYDIRDAARADDWEDWCSTRDGGWVWVPGRRVARPVYAPALVVFVGGGGRNFGVAWFPLGPEEPYVPAYHVSNTYFRNVNVTNVNVTNITVTNVNVTTINYRNRRAPDAFTVVSQETFARSRAVDKSVIVVPRERLDQARVVGSTARVVP